jgi:hypothetical protein
MEKTGATIWWPLFHAMAFVNTISFSHRFSSDKVMDDCCSYQEINHTYSADSAPAVARAFFQFMTGCGYAPGSVVDAMLSIGDEYGEAYCGYNGKKHDEQC